MSDQQKEMTSDQDFMLCCFAVLAISCLCFWPLAVVGLIGSFLYKKYPNKKLLTLIVLTSIYVFGIGVGFMFPSLSSDKLKAVYEKTPRIIYPLVVPLYLGSKLNETRITISNKAERIEKLKALKTIIHEEKISLFSKKIDPDPVSLELSEYEKIALGGENESKKLFLNPENFSKVNYHWFLIISAVKWLSSTQNDDRELKEYKINCVLAGWGILYVSGEYHQLNFMRNYDEKHNERVAKLREELAEIIP